MRIAILILLFSFPSWAVNFTFKTARESGDVSIQSNRIQFITPQKIGTVEFNKCEKFALNQLKNEVLNQVSKNAKDKKSVGSLFLFGRTHQIDKKTKIYRFLDSFHSSIDKLKAYAKMKCYREEKLSP